MKFRLAKCAALLLITFSALSSLWAGDAIPKIAWKQGIGVPLANPGTRKPALTDLITLKQFSPILPDSHRETSYPVAVYRREDELRQLQQRRFHTLARHRHHEIGSV